MVFMAPSRQLFNSQNHLQSLPGRVYMTSINVVSHQEMLPIAVVLITKWGSEQVYFLATKRYGLIITVL